MACGVVAPTRRGTPFEALAGSPGFTRSGAKARSKSTPAFSPLRSTTSAKGPVVVPGKVVDWSTISWPARTCPQIVSAADSTGARSGSFVAVIGVGTQTKIASASEIVESTGDPTRIPRSSAATEALVGDIVDRRGPGEELGDAAGRGVDAFDIESGLEKAMASGRPT